MSKTYSGTYASGINLANFPVNSPLTVTGVINAGAVDGLGGRVDPWTIDNTGTITPPLRHLSARRRIGRQRRLDHRGPMGC
jgi:hypothetical protein